MKTLLLIISMLSAIYCSSQYKFDVHVELSNANKSTIGLLDEHITTYDRYIDGNVISFVTSLNCSDRYIDSLFVMIGIEPFLVIKDKLITGQYSEKAGNNCEAAEQLCSGVNVSGVSGGPGTQELSASNRGCLGVENQSSWYYINIQTGGTLTFIINPSDNNNDYDFAVWGPFTAATAGLNCPPVNNPIRCSYAEVFGNGNTGLINDITPCDAFETMNCGGCFANTDCVYGDQFVNQLNVIAGNIYILLIDNWSVSNQGFNMSFGGTAVIGCTPVILPVELSEFKGTQSDAGNVLEWKTETETNNDYFILEWSIDPTKNDWAEIARVDGAGDAIASHHYAHMHSDYKYGAINYYRLTQVDYDSNEKVYDYLVAIDNAIDAAEVVGIFNVLGQEVDQFYRGIVIYQYADGTTEKRYKY